MAKAGSHVAQAPRHKAAGSATQNTRTENRGRQRKNQNSSRARRTAKRAADPTLKARGEAAQPSTPPAYSINAGRDEVVS